MQSVLVTGCNRGIGLSLIKQLLTKGNAKNVIATCRNKAKATELMALRDSNSELSILELDLKKLNEYDNFVKEVESITKDGGLNLLINNAGVTTKFTRISMLKLEDLMENLMVNTAAPIMLTKALLPLLRKAASHNSNLPVGVDRCAIVNISSILGSISDNTDGGFYPYRCSKSALNAATKSLSHDLKKENILTVAVHPGWCKTDMGGKNAPLEVDFATSTLLNTLKGLNDAHNGAFIQFDGKTLNY